LAFYQAANCIAATLTFSLQNQVTAFDAAGYIEHARGSSALSAPDRIQYFQSVFRRYCRPELLSLARKIVQRIFLCGFWDKMSAGLESAIRWGLYYQMAGVGVCVNNG